MPRTVTTQAVEIIPPAGYRTPAWYEARRAAVSASEIAAVLGLSPYQSRFDLWWEKRTGKGADENRAMSRGRRVEPLVLEDFADDHPEFHLRPFGLVQNTERPWQVCTPDQLAYEGGCDVHASHRPWADPVCRINAAPVAVVEAKTAGGNEGWGARGTDEIPVHYRCQGLWQMDTLGLDVAYFPVWVGFDYRCYVLTLDDDARLDLEFMRDEAQRFLDLLARDVQPAIDGQDSTTARLKRMHPALVEEAVTVPEGLVRQYHVAKQLRDAAADRVNRAENRLRQLLGDAKWGELADGQRIATRSVYDVKERTQTVRAYTVNKIAVRDIKDPAS
jgi:putative phage-type endonuclease